MTGTDRVVGVFESFVLGFCKCGCNEEIPLKSRTGHYLKRYQHGHNSKGENNPAYNGGRRMCNGYIIIYRPDHPKARRNIVYEHRWIFEQHNKCCLLSWSDIHHLNDIKTDNRPENLQGMMKSQHTVLEMTGKKRTIETRKKISTALKKRNIELKIGRE